MRIFTEYIAIDLGTCNLKMISLSPGPGGQGYSIHTFLRRDLPPGLVCGGFTNPTIRSVPEFARILKEVVEKIRDRKEGCIMGLPDRWVKLHVVELVLKQGEVNSPEYLSWRLRKLLCPPTAGEVMADHQILGLTETPEGKKYKVMVGLVQKSIVDLLANLLVELKIELMAFDTSTLGVYNLFEELFPDRSLDRSLIICHIGHETTVIKVFDRGILHYERVIEVGGEAFGKILAETENLSLQDAGKRLAEKRLFPVTREDLIRQIGDRHLFEKIFGNWLRELHVTFRFYQDKFKVTHLPPIYLTGGGSLMDGLPDFLSEFFAVPCQRFNPFHGIPWVGEMAPAMLAQGPQMAPCMGLLTP